MSVSKEPFAKQRGFVALPSKISMPTNTESLVEREAVRTKLGRVYENSVTSLISPAGFGKSTAVIAWAASAESCVAWFLAEDEDADDERFWTFLWAALCEADEHLADVLKDEAVSLDELHVLGSINTLLFHLESLDHPIVLVVEDFHTVQTTETICSSFDYFIRHLPAAVHIVLTSRYQLRLSLMRLKIAGNLNELTEDDLRFTQDEQDKLFELRGTTLSRSNSQAVYETTHGWPAGTKLVTLLCDSDTETEVMVGIGKARLDINAYLFDEVFRLLSPEIKSFLVATCVTGSFCVSLAEYICGITREQAVTCIDEIVMNDLFVEQVRQDEGESWYRYHQLFSDMLRSRLSRCKKAEIYNLKRRARDWYLKERYDEIAVELSVGIEDYASVRDIIISRWQELYMSDNLHTLARWGHYLPEAEMLMSTMVCVVLSMPFALEGDVARSEACVEAALKTVHENGDFLEGFFDYQKAVIASFQGNEIKMRTYADSALNVLAQNEYYFRGMALQVKATSYAHIQPLVAKALYIQLLDKQIQYRSENLTCSVYANLAYICAELGHLDEAKYYVRQAFGVYDESARASKAMLSHAHVVEMVCAYEEGRFSDVIEQYGKLNALFGCGLVPWVLAKGQMLRAKALARLGENGAKQAFFDAFSFNHEGALSGFATLDQVRAYCAFYGDSLPILDEEIRKIGHIQLFEYEIYFCLDRVAVFEDVCSFVDEINHNERFLYLNGLVLAAAFSDKVARTRRADMYLEKAVRAAFEARLPMVLEDNARYLAPIAQRLITQCDAQVAAYLAEHVQQKKKRNSDCVLTDRELDVVRLVASGLTVAEIASQLYVSRETVKKHLANTYSKLGVHSKIQAVEMLRKNEVI